jgi:rod shape-determining protein MreB
MTGGGSLLKGLPKLISKETGVSVIVAPNPLDCVALGAGKYFEKTKGYEHTRNIYSNLND